MREDIFFLYLLIGHVFICLLLYNNMKKKNIEAPWQMFAIALLLPVWGAVMLWVTHTFSQKGKIDSQRMDLEQVETRTRILARPFIEEELADKQLMSLEEALLLENPAVRRQLMKELVQEAPKQYIPILQRVRLSKDTEVSHYASTAIMQIQTDYELALHRQEQLLTKEKTAENWKVYASQLKEYISSDLLPKNAQLAQRGKLKTAIQEYLELEPDDRQMYIDAIDNLLELNQFEAANALMAILDSRWRQDETVFLLKLKLHYKQKNSPALRAEIKRAKDMNLYLKPDTREKIAFWSE